MVVAGIEVTRRSIGTIFICLSEVSADVQSPCGKIVVVSRCYNKITADMHFVILIIHNEITIRRSKRLTIGCKYRTFSRTVIASSDIKGSSAQSQRARLLVQRSAYCQCSAIKIEIATGYHVSGHGQFCSFKIMFSINYSQISVYCQVITIKFY